jgi:hypothetical protein
MIGFTGKFPPVTQVRGHCRLNNKMWVSNKMKKILWRVFLLMVLMALVTEAMRLGANFSERHRLYSEYGYIEWAQAALLLTNMVLLLSIARTSASVREMCNCMALLFAIMLIREKDQLLEVYLVDGAWKYFALPVLLGLLVYYWRNREKIAQQVVAFADSSAFGMFLAAALTLVFGRMFGRTVYWQPVMGEDYHPLMKTAVQESLELLSYLLLFLAILELRRQLRVRLRQEPSTGPATGPRPG